MMSLAMTPALAAGVSSIGATTFTKPSSMVTSHAETAEFAARLHLHVAVALRIHVARMRVEPREHAVDGRFDQLGIIGLLDVIGADALEHVTEQIELPVGV